MARTEPQLERKKLRNEKGRMQRPPSLSPGLVAPILSLLTLGTTFVLILINFDVLFGQKESNAAIWILPAIVILPGLVGIFWGCHLKKNRFETYRRIGLGPEAVETRLGMS